jgi:hypothetical protein
MVPGVLGTVIPCFRPGPSAGGSASRTPRDGDPQAGRADRPPHRRQGQALLALVGREVGAKVRPRGPRRLIGGKGKRAVGPVFPQEADDRRHARPCPGAGYSANSVPIFARKSAPLMPAPRRSAGPAAAPPHPWPSAARSRPLFGDQHHRVFAPPMIPVAGLTSLATIQSQPLRAAWPWHGLDHVSVSAAKPTTSRGRCGALRHRRQNVGVLGKLQRRGTARAVLLHLLRRPHWPPASRPPPPPSRPHRRARPPAPPPASGARFPPAPPRTPWGGGTWPAR